MNHIHNVIKFSCLSFFLIATSNSYAENSETQNTSSAESATIAKFTESSPSSTLILNFDLVNSLLDASVLDMGPSKRSWTAMEQPNTGTRIAQSVNLKTDLEGNKFTYELFNNDQQKEKLVTIKNYLENLPLDTPLNLYNKDEQLAYWLNLYNVSIINEVVKASPKRVLKPLLTGDSSILEQKLLNVAGVELSLNDIQHKILKTQYESDPLILYGLYQGIIGGPDILKTAFTGKNVYRLLEKNAINFINSNRGTTVNKRFHTVRTSYFYQLNADYFPDFNSDLKQHLLRFANDDVSGEIKLANELNPSITNWKVTDLYGTTQSFGKSAHVVVEGSDFQHQYDKQFAGALSRDQLLRMKNLMIVRAINLDGTSVTVTDLPSEDEQ